MDILIKEIKEKLIRPLSNFDILKYVEDANIYNYKDLTKFKTIEDAFYPYKIIFLDILINHNSEIGEKYKNYELLKLVTELKILNTSLKSTIVEKKLISKSKISLPHQIILSYILNNR